MILTESLSLEFLAGYFSSYSRKGDSPDQTGNGILNISPLTRSRLSRVPTKGYQTPHKASKKRIITSTAPL